jgi:FMN hydrolase / 5-amino-6-(5-phospho-D-ribitylamino)uracil phosphatase
VLSDVRAIAFDLDNTLWDVEPVLARAEMQLAAWLERNCPRITARLTAADMRAARAALAEREPHKAHDVTYLRVTALTAHAREHGYDERLAAEGFEVFLAARNQVDVFPDVLPALRALRRRYRLASFSNGNADLQRIGLHELFEVSLNAREVGAAKPAARCFEALAARLGLPAEQILHVGDDPHLDVAGARGAGLRTAWMSRGPAQWPAQLAPADLTVRTCGELVNALTTSVP